MKYLTFECKFYELEKRLSLYQKDGYFLHSFNVINSGFTENAFVVMEKRVGE